VPALRGPAALTEPVEVIAGVDPAVTLLTGQCRHHMNVLGAGLVVPDGYPPDPVLVTAADHPDAFQDVPGNARPLLIGKGQVWAEPLCRVGSC